MTGTTPGTGADSRRNGLDRILLDAVREVGAHVGLVYLVEPREQMLSMEVITGLPIDFASPWLRLRMDGTTPVADALRDQRLIWLADQEHLASAYPKAALSTPYPFAQAEAPVTSGSTPWGVLALLWPGSRPGELTARERSRITAACRRMGRFLAHAATIGQPLRPAPRPRAIEPPPVRQRQAGEAPAAAEYAERLPDGALALDLEGRITFSSVTGADLLGSTVDDLLGAMPWDVLPWLNDPVFEDRYRAAVISREPTSYSVLRPPGERLSFDLYPGATGVSIRITKAEASLRPVPDKGHTPVGSLYYLMPLAAGLTEAAGVRDVLDLLAEQIMPAFEAQTLTLMLTESGRLRLVGHRGDRSALVEEFDGAPLRDGKDPAARVVATGEPAFFPSWREMEQVHPELARKSTKGAWAVLPLIASGRPIGVCVLSYDAAHPFSADQRAVLTSLAGLIAQALDRARLYDTKHRLAHALQEALLPKALPSVPGLDIAARYLPGTHGMDIGGDFYDLIQLGGTEYAAVIGDVQGHNVNAAALMGQVRTAVHAHATAGAPPEAVLARTNRLLTDLDPGLFASCLYAHIDLADGKACLATAGHPPPLLCSADRRASLVHVPPGLLLGIDADCTYQPSEVSLPPDAVLALYTDGLVETPGEDPADSTAALASLLEAVADEPVEQLADSLIGHCEHRTDDIALLLVRPHGRPGG
ncbi:SpoIIE family protein phosphatase [Streptomyces daliensis]